MTTPLRSLAVAAALLLAACSPAPSTAPDTTAAAPAAPTPAPAAPAEPLAPAPPASSSPISFHGFADVVFGSPAAALAGKGITGTEPAEAGACYYAAQASADGAPAPVRFMIEGGRFMRIDVDATEIAAPGGGHIGNTLEAIKAGYPTVDVQPHKYVDGANTLVVADPEGGSAWLVFETDAQGVVTRWRIGLPPQVHYVEGCG